MTFQVSVGQSISTNSKEATRKAIDQAREILNTEAKPGFAFVITSEDYDLATVLDTIKTQIGDVPVFGFTSEKQFTNHMEQTRSICVGLITGGELAASTYWWQGSSKVNRQSLQKQLSHTEDPANKNLLLIASDGIRHDTEAMINSLPGGVYQLAGILTGSMSNQVRASQISNQQIGQDGTTLAAVSGNFQLGIGVAHGWHPIGIYFTATKTEGNWIRSLENYSAAETYARLFNNEAREWAFPPLSEIVRLYPLATEKGPNDLVVRSILRVEADGSFRMGLPIPTGSIAHFLIGSPATCQEAVYAACKQALASLEGAVPLLAIVLADTAYELMFATSTISLLDTISEVLGKDIPLIGGVGVGQLLRQNINSPEILNQHIQVVLLGSR